MIPGFAFFLCYDILKQKEYMLEREENEKFIKTDLGENCRSVNTAIWTESAKQTGIRANSE